MLFIYSNNGQALSQSAQAGVYCYRKTFF